MRYFGIYRTNLAKPGCVALCISPDFCFLAVTLSKQSCIQDRPHFTVAKWAEFVKKNIFFGTSQKLF